MMDREAATRALETFAKTEPKQKNFVGAYWEAHAAMKAGLEGVPGELMEAYFHNILRVWPEVRPDLEGHHSESLEALARVAESHPGSSYCVILSCYGQGAPDRMRRGYQWLDDAAQAASSARGGTPEQARSIREAAEDPDMVGCLQAAWPKFEGLLESRRPVGWGAILLREGSKTSVDLLRPAVERVGYDDPYNSLLDDLWWLRPEEPTAEAQSLLDRIAQGRAERDLATGQDAWFQALGLSNPPELFRLELVVTARSGHRFTLSVTREWRSSGVYWFAFLGKSKPVFTARTARVESNRLDLEPLELASLPEWLRAAAPRLKTSWQAIEIGEEGFDPPIRSALENWLAPALQ